MTRIVFGTTSIGLPYGLPDAAGEAPTLMPESTSVALLAAARGAGIRTFDTAPGYGVAEHRLGRVLAADDAVWTKIDRRQVSHDALADFARSSVQVSRSKLARTKLACVQWHNFEAAWLEERGFAAAMQALRDDPDISSIGATTYGVGNALAAVRSGLFGRVQVEWNLLSQGVVRTICDEARAHGVSLAVRSVLLQGALTSAGRTLPAKPLLHRTLEEARRYAAHLEGGLTELAYRAAFSLRGVANVLIGFRTEPEVEEARAFEQMPAIDLERIASLDLDGHPDADPRTW